MKVFGIGLHKTGLTTLRECFEILGLDVCPLDKAYEIREQVARGERFLAMELAAKYEAFADSPWNYHFMWQLLHGTFPGSLFILTHRDAERWFRSLLRWVNRNNSGNWMDMHLTLRMEFVTSNKHLLVKSYRKHNRVVRQYFARPQNLILGRKRAGKRPRLKSTLLQLDWETGQGWTELCQFLEKPLPNVPLPHMLRFDAASDSYVDSTPRNTSSR